MPYIWTNDNNRVERIKYDTGGSGNYGGFEVDSVPDRTTQNEWCACELYYTESGGFEKKVIDPFDVLESVSFTESEKRKIYNTYMRGDFEDLVKVVEEVV